MDLSCNPVEYMVDPSWPDAWRKPLYAAVQMWETVTGRDFIETETGGLYIAWASTEKMFGPRVQGATWGGSNVADQEFALVYIDERLHPGRRLRKVITHEIGHVVTILIYLYGAAGSHHFIPATKGTKTEKKDNQ